jgi:hypothetical protein
MTAEDSKFRYRSGSAKSLRILVAIALKTLASRARNLPLKPGTISTENVLEGLKSGNMAETCRED